MASEGPAESQRYLQAARRLLDGDADASSSSVVDLLLQSLTADPWNAQAYCVLATVLDDDDEDDDDDEEEEEEETDDDDRPTSPGKPTTPRVVLPDGTPIVDPNQLYLHAINVAPNAVDAYISLACTLQSPDTTVRLLNGQTITQRGLLLRAISLDAQCPKAFYSLGCTTLPGEIVELPDGRRLSEASLYATAVVLDPSFVMAYYNLGCALDPSLGPNPLPGVDRRDVFAVVTKQRPTYGMGWYNLGCAVMQAPYSSASSSSFSDQVPLGTPSLPHRSGGSSGAVEHSPSSGPISETLLPSVGALDDMGGRSKKGSRRAPEFQPSAWLAEELLDPTPLPSDPLPIHDIISLINNAFRSLPRGPWTAEKCFLEAIKVDPNYGPSYYNLACLVGDRPTGATLQLPDGSVASEADLYIRAIDLDPETAVYYFNLSCTFPPPEHVPLGVAKLEEEVHTVELLDGRCVTQRDLLLDFIDRDPDSPLGYMHMVGLLGRRERVRLLDGTALNAHGLLEAALARGGDGRQVAEALSVLSPPVTPNAHEGTQRPLVDPDAVELALRPRPWQGARGAS